MAILENAGPNGGGGYNSPLNILIAGSGIGGLATAIALRQQGHHVSIYEQSKLSQETGAAMNLTPNCTGLLARLGVDLAKIGAVECKGFFTFAPSGELKVRSDFSKPFKNRYCLVHRAHLHGMLKDIALSEDGNGRPVRLHLASRVKSTDPEHARITLEDGSVVQGDVLIGADGVHSQTRNSIPGGEQSPFDSGKSAYRFLVPTKVLAADPAVPKEPLQAGFLAMWIGDDKRVIMYPCDDSTTMNLAAIHPSRESARDISGDGWQEAGSKARMLEIFKDFAPSVHAILNKADDEKLRAWNLLDMKKLPSVVNGRLAVMGDAAHPFLPYQGQGGGMAIEDAMSLATLLPLGTPSSAVPERLQLYEQCRYERAHNIQEFTRLVGRDASELAAEGKVLNMTEYQAYCFNHDEYEHSSLALKKHLAA